MDIFRKTWLFGAIALLALLVLAAACGGDEEKEGASPTVTKSPAATGTATPAALDPTMPGAAGIASKPRPVEGYGNAWVLDDGLAMFKTRPASEDRTGVTATSIKVCHPIVLTGPSAVWAEYNALLAENVKRINTAGGIHGRQIEIVQRDDGGTPTSAVQVVKEMVENDKCFLIFGHKGTAIVLAVWDYLEEQGVPNFMFGSSASQAGEPGKPSALTAVFNALLGQYAFGLQIWKDTPGEKLAVLYQNDDFGKTGLAGFEAAAAETGGQIVVKIPIDPAATDVTGQLTEAINSGATAFSGLAFPAMWAKFVIGLRQTLGSDIKIYDPGALSAIGLATNPDKDALLDGLIATNPAAELMTSSNKAVQTVNSIVTAAGLKENQFAVTYGQPDIETLTRVLACAGPDLTRQGFIDAMNNGCLDGSWECSVCLAPTLITPADRWPAEAEQIMKYNATTKSWDIIAETGALETALGKAVRGNIAGFECSDKLPCPWEEDCLADETRCAWKE